MEHDNMKKFWTKLKFSDPIESLKKVQWPQMKFTTFIPISPID